MSEVMTEPTQKVTAVKGMPDILPPVSLAWQRLEQQISQLMHQYDFELMRTPLLESTQLFKRSMGVATDVVNKEMYSFDDRNGECLSLRPEGTASCVRACIEHALLRNAQVQKLWYLGPMYRYERPQKGRYRQFFQWGVESFNLPGVDCEMEQLLLCQRLWQQLGIDKAVQLEINTLGTPAARARYREALVAYFSDHLAALDQDSKNRLHTNPLRILDSKHPDMAPIIAQAPTLLQFLEPDSKRRFDTLQAQCAAFNLPVRHNPHLVRGLDYYTETVFEWTTTHLGAQAAICAGGRYDNLVAQLGGPATPAVGFAMGLERVLLLCEAVRAPMAVSLDGYLICVGEAAMAQQLQLAERIRDALPGFGLRLPLTGGSFKSQLKKADKSGARLALIVGEAELARDEVTIKWLRQEVPQQSVALASLAAVIREANDNG